GYPQSVKFESTDPGAQFRQRSGEKVENRARQGVFHSGATVPVAWGREGSGDEEEVGEPKMGGWGQVAKAAPPCSQARWQLAPSLGWTPLGARLRRRRE